MRLDRALAILNHADPLADTRNQETLGIAGAIYKAQWEFDPQQQSLDQALSYYLRGYQAGVARDQGYTAINAAYLIGGLWLLLGLRFGLWNERLLLAIPLYLFLFAIYYSVSSLAGLVWRNAIVSVVVAVVFWFVCWSLGTADTLVDTLSLKPRRLVSVVPAGKALLAASSGEVLRWDELGQSAEPDDPWGKVWVRVLFGVDL